MPSIAGIARYQRSLAEGMHRVHQHGIHPCSTVAYDAEFGMSALFQLDGKTALITGGASGIGEACARVFTGAGARVIVADVNTEAAERLAAGLPGARAVCCDIGDEASVAAMYSSIATLDILLNNAGIGMVGGIEETPLQDWERLMRVNVTGMYLVTRAAIPLLLASHGSIVNLGSVAGLVGIRKRFAYCATKGAVVAMTRQLAVEYPQQLRVNCICPGTVDSPFVEGYLERYHKHEKEKVRAELNLRQPIGRLGRPAEIAHMALYLSSDEAAFVTGSVVAIDGGWTAA
jgi:2-keto-3-deoxy-L-fuconate dehydrogenase